VSGGFSPGSGITRRSSHSISEAGRPGLLLKSVIVSFERSQLEFTEWRNWRKFLLIIDVQEEEEFLVRKACERGRTQKLRAGIFQRRK
jgi:hypothetical protein